MVGKARKALPLQRSFTSISGLAEKLGFSLNYSVRIDV
jgi:hypothetical protein